MNRRIDARSVFVSVPHGTSAGNMLRAAGILGRIRQAAPDATIVLLSPMSGDPAFVREFAGPGVVILDQPAHRPRGIEARLFSIVQSSYLRQAQTESVAIRLEEAKANGTIRHLGAKAAIGRLLVAPFTRRGSRYLMSDLLVSHPEMERLFDRYRPALVVAANPGLVFSELPLLRTARRRRVRTMAIDASWDNFTNKLVPVRHVDRLLVWNEIMKAQAVTLHGYDRDSIAVVGAPQFDGYFRTEPRATRQAFFARIGADPRRKLVTLTTTPRSLYPHHAFVLRGLLAAASRGEFHVPVHLLVRLHPRDDAGAYREFAGAPHLTVEKPFRDSVAVADGLAVDVMPEHQRHLSETMRHSDVALNVASTITIEACIFDTPVVNIAFDEGEMPFVRSARRYYRFTHYVNIMNRGAVRIAWSPAELVAHANTYLANRSLDADGRRRVVLDQCQFTDGRSAERVASCVAAELTGAPQPAAGAVATQLS
ncbi:MAG TPA: CDP-glycerol glycerophosphotransferase family protein [Vicinamibacterales bacterium]|nr:CDP-glycerol glycerophosphotransferase family protein [Vicinamibacterales bacterium]